MKITKPTTIQLRQWLITFSVCLSYFVFTIFGVIIAKYNMLIFQYVDLLFIPIGLSTILFLYLFTLTYESKMNMKLSENVLEAARLYGEGESFQSIADKLGFKQATDIKRLLTEFCKVRS